MFDLAVKMAWLNLWRRARRSLLVILMIAVSMAAMLAIEGLYDGMASDMILRTIRSDCGDISVYKPGYRLYQRLDHAMTDTSRLQAALSEMADVRCFVVRLALTGLVSTARKSSMARVVGIDAVKEQRFGRLGAFVREGELDWGERLNGCVIGSQLKKDLHVEVGDRIVFSSQNMQGDISAMALRVRGVIQTANPAIDNTAIFVSLRRSRSFAQVPPHAATQVAVRLFPGVPVSVVANRLKAMFPGLEVRTWKQLYPVLEQMQDMMRVFNAISFAIVMTMVLIGIFGVMLVSMLERTREFGILMAIGTPHSMLGVQVFTEAVVLGCLGFLCGAVLSYGVLYYLCHYGLDLRAFAEGLEAFGLNAIVHADMKWGYFVHSLFAILLASMVSVVLPLYRIFRLNPVGVIQEE